MPHAPHFDLSQAAFDALPQGAHRSAFGRHPSGREVEAITLRAGRFGARILTLGGTLQAFWVDGRDLVLGFDTLSGYLAERAFHGATVGRYANRIRDGRFTVDGQRYQIGTPADHALHGGPEGFDQAIWSVAELSERAVTLTLTSAAGDQGFPAMVRASVCYALSEAGLEITLRAQASAPTPINMTNHAYLNLGAPLAEHSLRVAAAAFLPSDAAGIPLGSGVGGPISVAGTALDFRAGQSLTAQIDAPELANRGGYDHNLCLDGDGLCLDGDGLRLDGDGLRLDGDGLRPEGGEMRPVARLSAGGIALDLWTDQPGLQVYSGNFMGGGAGEGAEQGGAIGKYGQRHAYRSALCLEPQAWPDSPNHPDYPFALTTPEAPYLSRIAWRFGR